MKSYVILEVFRIDIEQIIFSCFAEVNKKFPGQADFIGSVGKGETNNILNLA